MIASIIGEDKFGCRVPEDTRAAGAGRLADDILPGDWRYSSTRDPLFVCIPQVVRKML